MPYLLKSAPILSSALLLRAVPMIVAVVAAISGNASAQSSQSVQVAPFSFSVSGTDTSDGGSNSRVTISAEGALSASFNPFNPALGPLESVKIAWSLTTTATVSGSSGISVGTFGGGGLYLAGVNYSGTGGGGGGYSSGMMTISATQTFTQPGSSVDFNLVTGSSPVVAAFGSGTRITFNPYSGSQTYEGSTIGSATLTYTYSAVPEPSTYALFAGAACLGFVMIRRRSRRSRGVAEQSAR